MKPLFSVVLIARNESKTLPRLLESLAEFKARGGEVVLMDTGSTDGTPGIARELGCLVFEEGDRFTHTITPQSAHDINERFVVAGEEIVVMGGDRVFDYASARNHAASLASSKMIAMPDCDEIYTKLNIDVLNAAIEGGAEQLEYNFIFSHDDQGAPVIQFLHSKFYNRARLKWVGIIHEVLQGNAARQFLPENVIKLEHWQNPETNRAGYLKGLALSVINEPENDRNAHYFGRELWYRGRPHSAIKQLEAHVAMGKWAEERSQSQIHIGEAYMDLGETQKAIHAWIDAFDTCPTRREPLMKIAEYYYRLKSPEHTIVYAEAALRIPASSFYATFQPYYEQIPHEFLYWAYWHKGDKALAHYHFKQAIKFQPHNSQYLHDMRLFEDLPVMSIIIPTLRPAGLKRLEESIANLNYPADKLEVIVLHDEPRIGVPKRVAEGVEKSTGEWLVYAADDMEFEPDCLIEAYRAHCEKGDNFAPALIAFNAGPLTPDKGNICEHFMLHRIALEDGTDYGGHLNGQIFDTEFSHVGVDNLLWAKMEKAREALRAEHAKIVHHHFSRGGEMDDVHRLAWNPDEVARDRALLERKLKEI